MRNVHRSRADLADHPEKPPLVLVNLRNGETPVEDVPVEIR